MLIFKFVHIAQPKMSDSSEIDSASDRELLFNGARVDTDGTY